MMKNFLIILLMILSYLIGRLSVIPQHSGGPTQKILVRDTVIIEKPIEKIKYITRVDTIYNYQVVTSTDTLYQNIEVPIETKVYSDSTYKCQISGFNASLDWIKVVNHSTIESRYIERKRRFNHGLQVGAGYGLINKNIDVYVGYGFQLNF